MTALETIRHKFAWLDPVMDERLRRLWAAAEALALGHGGITLVARATGLARATISDGCRELCPPAGDLPPAPLPHGRVRRPGGGRKALPERAPGQGAAPGA